MAKNFLFRLLALPLMLSPATMHAESEDERFDTLFHSWLDKRLEMRPVIASKLGDHRYDHLLEDVSKASRARWVEHERETLAALTTSFKHSNLSRSRQIDAEIFQHALTEAIWTAENTNPFEQDPRTYNDYLSDSVYILLAQSTLPKETNIKNAIARMAKLPAVIKTARETLTKPPRPVLETSIKQNRGVISFYEKTIPRFNRHTCTG